MNHSKQLANRLREVILNGTWIANTNFKHQLENLDWQIACKPIENLNTIARLAQHIHYYISGILNVFESGTLEIRDKYSFDFPPLQSQNEWNAFLEKFWMDTEKLAVQIETLSDENLNLDFVDQKYGNYFRNIDAMIEHSYYHLGQIVLVKKMLMQ